MCSCANVGVVVGDDDEATTEVINDVEKSKQKHAPVQILAR